MGGSETEDGSFHCCCQVLAVGMDCQTLGWGNGPAVQGRQETGLESGEGERSDQGDWGQGERTVVGDQWWHWQGVTAGCADWLEEISVRSY